MSSAERNRGFDADSESDGKTTSEHFVSAIPGTESYVSWLLIGIGLALIFAGMFVATGEMTALYGLWGLSLIAAVLFVRVAYALWYALG